MDFLFPSIYHHDSFCFSTPDKNRTSTQATLQIPQVEADSSTSPEVIQVDRNPSPDYKPTTDSLLNNRMVHNLHISSTTSFSNYSFERSLNEFIEYVRNILHQYHHESVFIKLFEYLCTLQGLSSITLDRLKVQIQPTDEHDKEFYHDALDKIEKILRSIKVLIDLNKMRISHIDQQSIIVDLFNQFQTNFNIIHDQWNNTTTNNQRSTSTSSTNRTNDRAPSKSSSSTHRSITASNHANDTAPSRSTSSTYRSTNLLIIQLIQHHQDRLPQQIILRLLTNIQMIQHHQAPFLQSIILQLLLLLQEIIQHRHRRILRQETIHPQDHFHQATIQRLLHQEIIQQIERHQEIIQQIGHHQAIIQQIEHHQEITQLILTKNIILITKSFE
ncbi:hypothetical protein I4U23_012069 [Adineta vaga]|nr:hypothetical protein I4U23_012069 [Adineta vaga]